MWECLLFNVQSEAIWKRGLQVPLTLLPSCTQWGGVFRLGSRSARGGAAELGLFLLPWQCRLAPPSICSFGTYSCNDYEQSLIKLQRIIPRNHRVCMCVWGYFDRCLCVCSCVVLSRCLHACARMIGAYPRQRVCLCACQRPRCLALFSFCHADDAKLSPWQITSVCYALFAPHNGEC